MSLNVLVEITDPKVNAHPITTKGGNSMTLYKQSAYIFKPNEKYPTQFELLVESQSTGYPVGKYSIDPSSLYVGRFNKLEISPRLLPAKNSSQ